LSCRFIAGQFGKKNCLRLAKAKLFFANRHEHNVIDQPRLPDKDSDHDKNRQIVNLSICPWFPQGHAHVIQSAPAVSFVGSHSLDHFVRLVPACLVNLSGPLT